MGTFWNGFGLTGLLLPLLIPVGTAIYVLRLSRRIHRIDPDRKRHPIVPVFLHVGLVLAVYWTLEFLKTALPPTAPKPILIGVIVVIPALQMASYAVVPVWLHRRLRTLMPPPSRPVPVDALLPQRRKAVRAAWVIVISGALLPWLVAVAVKLYLSAADRPTFPFSSFVNPSSPALLAASLVQWTFPFVVLGLIVRFRSLSAGELPFPERLKLAWIVHATGLAAGVLLFWGVFWDFDFMYLFVPLGLFLIPPMLIAYWVSRTLMRRRKPVAASIPD